MEFVWDDTKNESNTRKYGLSFEEATELFLSGDDHLELFDEAHSEHEDRFIAIGPVKRGVIVVVFTIVEDDVTRIISARIATRKEVATYRQHAETWR